MNIPNEWQGFNILITESDDVFHIEGDIVGHRFILMELLDPNEEWYDGIEDSTVRSLAKSITKSRNFRTVLAYAYGDHYVLYNGHHRVSLLKEWGFQYAPVTITNELRWRSRNRSRPVSKKGVIEC